MAYINIDNKKLKELMKKEDTILIDIRTREEYEENNIENSINIPLNNLLFEIDELEEYKEKNVIVYCRSGHRSVTACNLLHMEGFNKLYNLEKGIIGL
ncbi:rhodanese-like domain-containing protein [Romboutsia sp. 1001713B170131_170501_G6]|uniref:rhodanese-like domain-containing protein n=1 Tax=Romboutsia sp. 1001713B170131_170501_G6 TaxID=2787108 RepID=UPI0018A8C1A0|nr:rhodanese-like domain-containing protein [Romboutsia sp. 1001713B170131_170501_G6]